MSAYREQKTALSDARCLMEALQGMTNPRTHQLFKPARHATAVQLEGYHGDKRQQTAEIVIPRAQVGPASNDIGFKRQDDGTYAAVISQFDSQWFNEAWLTELRGKAFEAKANRIAEKSDLKPINRQVLPNGRIRLQYATRG